MQLNVDPNQEENRHAGISHREDEATACTEKKGIETTTTTKSVFFLKNYKSPKF